MTGALQVTPHHSLSFVTATGPAVLDMDQTVRAGANVVGGEKDVLGGVADEEEVGRLDRWTAMMGMGRALVNVAQNKSEGQGEGHCRLDSAVH